MKKIIIGLAGMLCSVVHGYVPANHSRQPAEEKVVAFYNLENCYDTLDDPFTADEEFTPGGSKQYTAEILQHKLNNLSRVISELGPPGRLSPPDLLGVAEVENRFVLNLLIRQPLLASARYRIVHFDSPDPRGIDVALLYQPGSFSVIDSKPISVSLPGGTKEVRYTRDILYVKGVMEGDTLHVLVNHWPSRRGGEVRSAPARMAAALICRRIIDSIVRKQSGAAVVVMGDLNDDPDSRSIVHWLGASGERVRAGSHVLFNPWVDFYKRGIGTLANKDRWGLFDQIIISRSLLAPNSGGWHWRLAGIHRKPYMMENQGRYKGYPMRTWDGNRYRGGFSDHFPTYITLGRGQG
jgi:endonuclease/exonuclease/phosphatase family metal-dependent hydrolase